MADYSEDSFGPSWSRVPKSGSTVIPPEDRAAAEKLTEAINRLTAEKIAREDVVNHPTHYTSHPSGVECLEITRHHDFVIGSAIKYLWRAGLKGGSEKELEDLRKARFYIDDRIKTLELEKENVTDGPG